MPIPDDGWYLARDTELRGFFVVGKWKGTFMVQGDLRRAGKRVSSIRVSIGDTREMTTSTARAIANGYLSQISQGQHPKAGKQSGQDDPMENATNGVGIKLVTLKQAWQRYLESHLVRKSRSERTIGGYRDHVERVFVEWLDTPLHDLAADPARIAKKHDDLTKENGPYLANGSMRTLRAIYKHARKTNKTLPPDNPADAVDWNNEKRRKTGMGTRDLKGWFMELAALDNPVRREFHLFMLLSGSRPAALQETTLSDIDFRRRILRIPKPKGGEERGFDIPLSREMILCLIRAIRFGRIMYPSQALKWVFPAHSASGHLAETKEDRAMLSKWGNDLRQTFRTVAVAARVAPIDAELLMNHTVPGVNAGYITRDKILQDHLLHQQQAISSAVFATLGASLSDHQALQNWLGRGAARRAILGARIKPTDCDNEQATRPCGLASSRTAACHLPQALGFGPGPVPQPPSVRRCGRPGLTTSPQDPSGRWVVRIQNVAARH